METKKMKKLKKAEIGQVQETYWDMVANEARNRVGEQTQIKGTIHEIVLRDKMNLSPKSILSGDRTILTRSKHSTTVDLTTINNGKIVARYQAKDVVSRRGVEKLVKQSSSGKYRTAKLIGTEETKTLYDLKRPANGKEMHSSGISSRSTTRAADNTGAKIRGGDILTNNLKDIAGQAGNSAIFSGILSGGYEAVSGISDYKNGSITGTEYAGRVAKTTIAVAATSGAKTAVALGMKEGGKVVAKRISSEAAKKLAGSNVATAVAFGLVDQVVETARFINGSIDGKEYGSRTVQNVTGTGGALGGAALGASIGSVVPILGTAVGGVIGAIAGGLGGSSIGKWVSGWF